MIKIRIETERKENFKKMAAKKNISISKFVRDAVEERLEDNELLDLFTLLNDQGNIFQGVDSEINQLAKNCNSKKYVTNNDINKSLDLIKTVLILKREQNKVFQRLYEKIKNGH